MTACKPSSCLLRHNSATKWYFAPKLSKLCIFAASIHLKIVEIPLVQCEWQIEYFICAVHAKVEPGTTWVFHPPDHSARNSLYTPGDRGRSDGRGKREAKEGWAKRGQSCWGRRKAEQSRANHVGAEGRPSKAGPIMLGPKENGGLFLLARFFPSLWIFFHSS